MAEETEARKVPDEPRGGPRGPHPPACTSGGSPCFRGPGRRGLELQTCRVSGRRASGARPPGPGGSACAPASHPRFSPGISQPGGQPLQVCAAGGWDAPRPVLCGGNIPGSSPGDTGLLGGGPSGTRVSSPAPPPACLGDEWAEEEVIFCSLCGPPICFPSQPGAVTWAGVGGGALWRGGAALAVGYPPLEEEHWEGECPRVRAPSPTCLDDVPVPLFL